MFIKKLVRVFWVNFSIFLILHKRSRLHSFVTCLIIYMFYAYICILHVFAYMSYFYPGEIQCTWLQRWFVKFLFQRFLFILYKLNKTFIKHHRRFVWVRCCAGIDVNIKNEVALGWHSKFFYSSTGATTTIRMVLSLIIGLLCYFEQKFASYSPIKVQCQHNNIFIYDNKMLWSARLFVGDAAVCCACCWLLTSNTFESAECDLAVEHTDAADTEIVFAFISVSVVL